MENNLPVIGTGQPLTSSKRSPTNASNLWDPEETYPGGFKVSNVVKGTRVYDLVELVGGMGSGTTITFVASDGFVSTLPYSSIYTNPAVQDRQGDAFIAWWGDGQYVPMYADGMRLFFTSGVDHVYGHWDMHETLPSSYWRYNTQGGVEYPSSAGLSAKQIVDYQGLIPLRNPTGRLNWMAGISAVSIIPSLNHSSKRQLAASSGLNIKQPILTVKAGSGKVCPSGSLSGLLMMLISILLSLIT